MVFNSLPFLVFLPIVFLLYWFVVNRNFRVQNAFLLVASYVFYGWWDWWFLSLIIASSATDFFTGIRIGGATNEREKRLWLLMSVVVNLTILGFFKYFNFFVESFVDLFQLAGVSLDVSTLSIILPVGISFYTFQSLSYTIDIYRGKLEPTRDPITFFSFVAFFPQLVAGPIERATNLIPQFSRERNFDYEQAVSGCRLILWGLFKKIVIADGLAHTVDLIYANPYDHSGLTILFATICFTFQIYADFSGYSDIAIGVARLFGFDLMTNFRTPLFSKTFQELWRRWHISLSTWFRDYFYFSLGGNKVSTPRWLLNMFLTFLVSGLWHGASINFLIWGGLLGFIFALEALILKYKVLNFSLPTIIQMWYPFLVFTIAFIFFRAQTMPEAFYMFNAVFDPSEYAITGMSLPSLFKSHAIMWQFSASFILFMLIEILIGKKDFDLLIQQSRRPLRWGTYYFLAIWIILFGNFDIEPTFVYFQF
ncbi:MAG: MBOAT family O-acyltransferase [Bacteroidota bacterium]